VVGEMEAMEVDQKWVFQKKAASKDVQEIMLDKNIGLKTRKIELQTYINKGELKRFLGCFTEVDRDVKRRKMTNRTVTGNPKQFIGKRVAKEFAIQDPNDSSKMMDAVFFGTVEYISDEAKLWYFVNYDDGDSEEYGMTELQHGIKLYEANRDDDIRAKTIHARGEGSFDEQDGEHKIEIDQDTGEPIHGPKTIPKNMATLIDL
jgi:acetyl/propionyl-CoA carboxylase alpha subunit